MSTIPAIAANSNCNDTATTNVLIVDQRSELVSAIAGKLSALRIDASAWGSPTSELQNYLEEHRVDSVVFSPLLDDGRAELPSVERTREVVDACSSAGVQRFTLLSSAQVYGAHYCNPGAILEKSDIILKTRNQLAETWAEVESLARVSFDHGEAELAILRPCFTLFAEGNDFASRLFRSRFGIRLAGYDPTIQLLSVEDLAAVISAVAAKNAEGVFNVAPDVPIPLRKALRISRSLSVPVPSSLYSQWSFRHRGFELAKRDYIKYSWTVSNQKVKNETGLTFNSTSAEVVSDFARKSNGSGRPLPEADTIHDTFGMDREYIRSCAKHQLGFMEKSYWRIESTGWEHIPKDGGAVLVGIHRGFMPFDGVMMVHMTTKYTQRVPRFLIHPALVKQPYLAGFLTRIGGIIACQENADDTLENEKLLAVFPEGIRGAFREYDHGKVYRLGKFRDDYASAAIRHGVPIIPFVIVGQAETFPIFKKINWAWWKRQTHWPCFPITATWPLLPAPLPSKWHVKILEAIPTAGISPDAACEREVVRKLSKRVKSQMQTAIDEMLSRRKSVFFGSVFEAELRQCNQDLAASAEQLHSDGVG